MRGRQYREADEWADDDADERWPITESEDERWESARRRAAVLSGAAERPVVNPYAIVALAAALLFLVPVAIVFGLLAFSHPKGKAMAVVSVLLGIVEAAVLAGVLTIMGAKLPHDLSSNATGTVAVTTTATTAAPVPTTVAPTTPAAPPEAVAGTACTPAQSALIGQASDGTTVICLHSGNGYRWAGPYTLSTTAHDAGTPCTAGTDKGARTADGHALVCERSGSATTWALWVE
ncbi:hypothetical protein [Nocardia stercoris]|uniref:DUF4190 domain-containing protein n=1 Tax=Nocardia stercoris TaxID=2483361 RepID=A0A3M2L8V2_9NOCA|nr:hypothetical protein [Nocardia stercoris]RMI34041.1 hypothetical protein EBN03_06270 [Nocardia stercoris]